MLRNFAMKMEISTKMAWTMDAVNDRRRGVLQRQTRAAVTMLRLRICAMRLKRIVSFRLCFGNLSTLPANSPIDSVRSKAVCFFFRFVCSLIIIDAAVSVNCRRTSHLFILRSLFRKNEIYF